MKKLKLIKSIFLGTLAATAAIATPVLVTSCASELNQNTNSTDVSLVKYNAVQTKKTTQQTNKLNFVKKADEVTDDTNNTSNEEIALDPNQSDDAMNKASETFKNLTKEKLQDDFDKVLTKFYKIYEFEQETKDNETETEIEAELRKVTVKDINDLTVKVDAEFYVETETENDKTDEESKTKETVIQEKTFTISPMFATQSEIEYLTNMLTDAKNQESKEGGFELDVEDLYELYVGDKKDNEKSIFEEVEAFTTETKLGGLLGYKIKLNDLQYTPDNSSSSQNSQNKNNSNNNSQITGDTELFAPSFSIREYFQPNQETVEGIDFSFNYSVLSQKTESEIKALTKDNIDGIFANITEEQKKLISSVKFEDDQQNDAIKLTLEIVQNSSSSIPTPSESETGGENQNSENNQSQTEGTEEGKSTEGEQSSEQTASSTEEGTEESTTDQTTDSQQTETQQTVSVVLQINKLWLKVSTSSSNTNQEQNNENGSSGTESKEENNNNSNNSQSSGTEETK